jgi:hypothetical protein
MAEGAPKGKRGGGGGAGGAKFEAKELFACGSFQKNPREQIHVKIMDYNGRAFLDIRTYWRSGEEGAWRPSAKGCTIPLENFGDFANAFTRAAEWVKRDEDAPPDPHQATQDVPY